MTERKKKTNPRTRTAADEENLDRIRFSTMVSLFEAMGISEKGIEIVYDYLLTHELIDDPKTIFESLGLSLKRVYKILGLLKDMGLIQVYDRPMKIYKTDVVRAWQEIVSQKIARLKTELNEKIEGIEDSVRRMLKAYNVPDPMMSPPVEFVAYNNQENPLEYIQNILSVKRECMIAKEMRYNTPLIQELNELIMDPERHGYGSIQDLKAALQSIFGRASIQVLISKEFAQEFFEMKNRTSDAQKVFAELQDLQVNIQIRMTDTSVGNIIIKDNTELLQLSFAPNNLLVGAFISRQNEILTIFSKKLQSLYDDAQDFAEFYRKQHNLELTIPEMVLLLMA